MARAAGLRCEVIRAYEFTHLDGQVGRAKHVAVSWQYRELVAQEMGRRRAVEVAGVA